MKLNKASKILNELKSIRKRLRYEYYKDDCDEYVVYATEDLDVVVEGIENHIESIKETLKK